MVDLSTATAESVNTVYVQLNERVGPKATLETAVAAGIPRGTLGLKTNMTNILGTSLPARARHGQRLRHDRQPGSAQRALLHLARSAAAGTAQGSSRSPPRAPGCSARTSWPTPPTPCNRSSSTGPAPTPGPWDVRWPARPAPRAATCRPGSWASPRSCRPQSAIYKSKPNGDADTLVGWGRYKGQEVSGPTFPVGCGPSTCRPCSRASRSSTSRHPPTVERPRTRLRHPRRPPRRRPTPLRPRRPTAAARAVVAVVVVASPVRAAAERGAADTRAADPDRWWRWRRHRDPAGDGLSHDLSSPAVAGARRRWTGAGGRPPSRADPVVRALSGVSAARPDGGWPAAPPCGGRCRCWCCWLRDDGRQRGAQGVVPGRRLDYPGPVLCTPATATSPSSYGSVRALGWSRPYVGRRDRRRWHGAAAARRSRRSGRSRGERRHRATAARGSSSTRRRWCSRRARCWRWSLWLFTPDDDAAGTAAHLALARCC